MKPEYCIGSQTPDLGYLNAAEWIVCGSSIALQNFEMVDN